MPRCARDETEVNRLGITETSPLGHLDRVDVTDQVADGGVGRGELLGVPLRAMPPRDGQIFAEFRGQPPTGRADRVERVFAQLGPCDHGRPFVQQADQGTQQPGLALAALAEQHDVVPRQQRAFQLRHHRPVEPDDAGPGVAAGTQQREQVLADLGLHATRQIAGRTQVARGRGQVCGNFHEFDATSISPSGRPGNKRRPPGTLSPGDEGTHPFGLPDSCTGPRSPEPAIPSESDSHSRKAPV